MDFIREFIVSYKEEEIARSSAALAYYLLFSFFPLALFLSSAFSYLNINIDHLISFIPKEIMDIYNAYTVHISIGNSKKLLFFSFVFSVYIPFRAVNMLLKYVKRAYFIEVDTPALRNVLVVSALSVFIFFAGVVSMFLIVSGEEILFKLNLAVHFARLWELLRFMLLGLVLFGLLTAVYKTAVSKRELPVLPGAAFALAFWLIFSYGFSIYINRFASYSLLYGSISAVMVLVLWLYFSAMAILLGAKFNYLYFIMNK